MKAHLEETADAAGKVESLQLELKQSQSELEECRHRMSELEHSEALLAGAAAGSGDVGACASSGTASAAKEDKG